MPARAMATAAAESIHKVCCECGEMKPLATAFLPGSACAGGYTGKCRQCIWAAARRDRSVREARKPMQAS
jgi:hypothetical protein